MSGSPNIELVDPENRDLIRQALKSVLASDEFLRSERLSTFLTHLIENTLKGETHKLKGYALGVDVFNKAEDFNPDTDTIVRVHAVRLRAALDNYYSGQGAGDALQIRLPKGRYIPVFEDKAHDAANKIQSGSPVHMPLGPMLTILPVENISEDGASTDQSRGLTLQVVNDLTRFRNLRVVSMQTVLKLKSDKTIDSGFLNELGTDYVLTLSLLNTGRVFVVSAQLIDPVDMQTLWSEMFERDFEAKHTKAILQDIASHIAAFTGGSYGAIAVAEARRIRDNPQLLSSAYRCMRGFFDYVAHKSQEAHKKQRSCLEEIVKNYPDTARAWAKLAWIYGDEIRFNYNQRPGNDAIKRSLVAARKGADIDPTDSFVLAHLAQSLELDGQYDLAAEHLEKALKLNPNDTELLASTALHYANHGDWDRAEILSNKSIELSPKHPNWFRAVPYMVHLRKGEFDRAIADVETLFDEGSPLVDLGRLVAYAKQGKKDEARQILATFEKNYPGYADKIEDGFKQRRLPLEVARMIQDIIDQLR